MATQFHSIGDRQELPTTGVPGDVYYHKKHLFLAMPDGTLTPLNRLLSDTHTLGILLARGEKGEQGEPGLPGRDSTAPGPKGDKGDPGPQGPAGDITVVGDAELLAAVNKLKAQKAAALARIKTNLDAMGNHPVYRVAKLHLQAIRKDLEK